jgi:hypothetical protein
MRTWSIAAILMQLTLGTLIRACGEDRKMRQVPSSLDLYVAADVKDTARVDTQWLVMHRGGSMTPRVPSNAIDSDAATAEFLTDLTQTHTEVAAQELDTTRFDQVRQCIHETRIGLWPFAFHGPGMPMRSAHRNAFPKQANVLFEFNHTNHNPRFRHFGFLFVCQR